MSGLDVEALLDSTASSKEQTSKGTANGDSPQNGSRSERDRDRRSRDRSREGDRDRGHRRRDRSPGRHRNSSSGRETPRSDAGSHKSRRRSRSRDSGRHSRRHRTDGDFYRGSNRGGRGGRSRSRSPNRYYRPPGEERRDREDRGHRRRDEDRRGARQGTPRETSPTGDERDRRTVFVQQLAARLRTRELKEFFEKVGPVAEAQIVKDRVSNRSKGYVSPPCFESIHSRS
jgi:RNA-binding protein 39